MWDKVRVQGGAYGGFAAFDIHSGVYSYLSYRDPNLVDTLKIYDQTPHFLRTLSLSDSELTKSIIGAIGELDAYQLPDAKGYTSLIRHLLGISDHWRQQFREQLLGTSASDFKHLAEPLQKIADEGNIAVLGSKEALKKVEGERPGWMNVVQII